MVTIWFNRWGAGPGRPCSLILTSSRRSQAETVTQCAWFDGAGSGRRGLAVGRCRRGGGCGGDECRRVVVGFVFVAETWSVIRDPGGDEGQIGLLDSLLDRLGRRVGR